MVAGSALVEFSHRSSTSKTIAVLYTAAGFTPSELIPSQSWRFENRFSIHFVHLFPSVAEAKAEWEACHQALVDDYANDSTKRDKEWNYYAVFIIENCEEEESGSFNALRSRIANDTKFSRKYLVTSNDVHMLPPGRMPDLSIQKVEYASEQATTEWMSVLDEGIFDLVTHGSKSEMEARLWEYINDEPF